ncbi:MAG: DEAD/DEAH box helicase [Nocardia sp.]|nr:DEAD/DEAH box helicase [Nocardia sp.]
MTPKTPALNAESETPESAGRSLLNRVLSGVPDGERGLTHSTELPARAAQVGDWPDWVSAEVIEALGESGIRVPWSHQVRTADLARAGTHVVVATGTASGKSLGYQLPVLTDLHRDQRACALYLAPTKALGADQFRAIVQLTGSGVLREVHPATYDGDTGSEVRQWVRANGRWIFTNPDMLHAGILRAHPRWARVLRGLRYVVVDECHAYRGIFGSQVAMVLRRLRRLAAHYGADPVFVLCSATTAEPAAAAERLIGAPVTAVTDDGSPRGARTIALWEPPLLEGSAGENGAPIRRAANTEAAHIMSELVAEGARTLTFVRSRRSAETVALDARRHLSRTDPALVERVAAYRSGYLAEDRRELESALSDGALLGAATTSALELGVDIAGLDAVVMAGFPGTVASFWQQAGRAGRRKQGSLVLMVARDDPLDTYLVHHPDALLETPVEATVTDPHNPCVAAPHLLCAAGEHPLTDAEIHEFGSWAVAQDLATQGLLKRREYRSGPARWHPTSADDPHDELELRAGVGGQVAIVDIATGQLLGSADSGRAPATLHTGAVHLHQGESYVVDELDLDGQVAFVHADDPGWTTSSRATTSVAVAGSLRTQVYDQVTVTLAEVLVTSRVVGYLRKLPGGEVLDLIELDLPEQVLPTRAVFWTLTPRLLAIAGITPRRVPGALHAAEHAAIGMLPLVASCDRWDVGGVSIADHPDTGLPTVFVYDGHRGGAGFAERGFTRLRTWLTATHSAITSCTCQHGCPSCVQSPKCGNGNSPLDKSGAAALLTALLTELPEQDPSPRTNKQDDGSVN